VIRFVLARLGGAVLVAFCVATFGFLALRAAPGGPLDSERRLPPAVEANIRRVYHLDEPTSKQYLRYMTGLVQGQLGQSMKRAETVNEIIALNFPASLRLGLLALCFAVGFGMLLGLVAAVKRDRWPDHLAMVISLVGISVPAFVLGPLLVQWFSIRLGWLPPARLEGFSSMILPALTLGLIYTGAIARLTRAGMLEVLRQDYVRTARAKGLSGARVLFVHAFRLGVTPVVTYLGPATAYLVTGSFVVEKIFQVPGLGFYFIGAVVDRDYPVLTGIMVFYCVFLVGLNLLVDLTYAVLDPRLRRKVAR
jgi:oligopeptide transport system permease protein